MAQIEAFLRTGEAPPAAPEPVSIPHPHERPLASEGDDHPGARPGTRPDAGPRPAGAARPGPGGGHPAGEGAARGALTAGDGAFWRRRVERMRSREASRRPPADGAPSWTPVRVVGVVAFLLALVVLPVIWSNHMDRVSPDGPDHASAAPAGPGYSFLRVNRSGTPVRWDPCTPIFYQLDLDAAPAWAQADLARAIATISTATGIDFVYDGPTTRFPGSGVALGSGSAQSPVVIAWATPAQSRTLQMPTGPAGEGSGFASLGRTEPVVSVDEVTGHMVYVSGTVVFGAAATALPPGSGPGSDGILMLHELGRLVGLGDAQAAGQVMSTDALSSGVSSLGPGDRTGLSRLGSSSGCLKVPANGTLEPVL